MNGDQFCMSVNLLSGGCPCVYDHNTAVCQLAMLRCLSLSTLRVSRYEQVYQLLEYRCHSISLP